MDRTKIKGMLGIAQKAGALIRGGDNLDGYEKKLYLALMDTTAGKSTRKIADRLKEKCKIIEVEDLTDLVGRECKLVALKNKGISEAIEKLI